MTEVKVGQVWRDTHTGQQFTVTPKESFDLIDNETKWAWNAPAKDFGQDLELVKDAEPEPSDLEIVQKALGDSLRLRMSGNDWFVLSVCAIIDSGEDYKSLISWAKQQIGDKSDLQQ